METRFNKKKGEYESAFQTLRQSVDSTAEKYNELWTTRDVKKAVDALRIKTKASRIHLGSKRFWELKNEVDERVAASRMSAIEE